MRSDADPNDILLALSDAVESTFNSSDWDRLKLKAKGGWIIEEDDRLLRSLHFCDDDYGSSVIRVIENLIEKDPENIQIIEKYVELKPYLEKHDPALYRRLYEPTMAINGSDSISTTFDNVEIRKQYARIRSSIENDDPALTIGASKDLLETVLKNILDELEQSYTHNDDMPNLLKKVQRCLNIDPSSQAAKVNEWSKRTLNNFAQVVVGVAEIRNLAGTGHGRTSTPDVDKNHASLVLNSVYTVSVYLNSLLRDRQQ